MQGQFRMEDIFFLIARDIKQKLTDRDHKTEVYCITMLFYYQSNHQVQGIVAYDQFCYGYFNINLDDVAACVFS